MSQFKKKSIKVSGMKGRTVGNGRCGRWLKEMEMVRLEKMRAMMPSDLLTDEGGERTRMEVQ